MDDAEEQSARSDRQTEREPPVSRPAAMTPPIVPIQDATVPLGPASPLDAPQGYTPPTAWSAIRPQASGYSRPLNSPQNPTMGPYHAPYTTPFGYTPPLPPRHATSRWSWQQGFFQSAAGAAWRTILIGVAVLLVLVLLSGLGFAVVRALNPGPQGYLWTSSTEVDFVEWTEDSSHHLSGTLQSVSATSDSTVKSTTAAFTGVHDGANISITFSTLGFSSTFTGTLNNDTLTLTVPDQNGLLATDAFHLASVEEYNSVVSALRQRIQIQSAATQSAQATIVAQQTQAQATAAAQSQLDQAVAAANSLLSGDLSALSTNVRALASATSFSDALNAYASSWSQMQSDYQKEQTDSQQGCGSNGYNAGVVSYDAGVVKYDLGTIQYDDGTLSYDQNTMSAPLATVQSGISSVKADWQNLKAAVAADTTGNVLAQFSQSDIDAAVQIAQQQINTSDSALSQAQSQGSQYDQEAAQLNTEAQNLASSMHC